MAIKVSRNMQQVYRVYNVTNSHIFTCTCWLYCHCEASVRGHEIFKLCRHMAAHCTYDPVFWSSVNSARAALDTVYCLHFVLVITVTPRTPRITSREVLRMSTFAELPTDEILSSSIWVQKRESNWNPNPNTPEPDRPLYDRPSVVLSPNSILPPLSLYYKERFGARFRY